MLFLTSFKAIVQTQLPQEVSFRTSTRKRRNTTLNYYGSSLKEHEYDIRLIEEDLINFSQVICCSNP